MITSWFDLSGVVALVTGATSGIGRAIAHAMAAHGATVVVVGLDDAEARSTAAEIRAAGGTAFGFGCDVSDADAVRALVRRTEREVGTVQALVCNAGVQGPAGPAAETDDNDWDRVMGVNVRGALGLTSLLVPAMAEAGGGSVILMSSIAGLRGNRAIGLYGLSKAALAQHARNIAVEWGPKGVRANSISPGLIRTPFSEELMADRAFMARRLALTPLRRVGEPQEVAGVAVMLASAAGAFITGQNLVVDGGTTVSDGSDGGDAPALAELVDLANGGPT